MHACHMQVDASSAKLAHDQAAIDYCFKSALDYKAAGMSAAQAVLKVLTTLKEVADSAQVRLLVSIYFCRIWECTLLVLISSAAAWHSNTAPCSASSEVAPGSLDVDERSCCMHD